VIAPIPGDAASLLWFLQQRINILISLARFGSFPLRYTGPLRSRKRPVTGCR
jgi:hypothetical protein